MARNYAIEGNATNTASATLPLLTLISAATVRPRIHEIILGSDGTPADSAAKHMLQRCTSAGTAGSAITPQPWDPADPASLSSCGLAIFGAGPTLTANAFLLTIAVNQRAAFRWVAQQGREIVAPATAANGIALMSTVVGGVGAWNLDMHLAFEE